MSEYSSEDYIHPKDLEEYYKSKEKRIKTRKSLRIRSPLLYASGFGGIYTRELGLWPLQETTPSFSSLLSETDFIEEIEKKKKEVMRFLFSHYAQMLSSQLINMPVEVEQEFYESCTQSDVYNPTNRTKQSVTWWLLVQRWKKNSTGYFLSGYNKDSHSCVNLSGRIDKYVSHSKNPLLETTLHIDKVPYKSSIDFMLFQNNSNLYPSAALFPGISTSNEGNINTDFINFFSGNPEIPCEEVLSQISTTMYGAVNDVWQDPKYSVNS